MSEAIETTRENLGKVRRGGRGARRELRADRTTHMLPALKRNLPVVEPMSPEQVEKIDNASMAILEEVGVVFRDADRAGRLEESRS